MRSVLTATAPSSAHGSQVSIGPMLIPSQVKKPSQPEASASRAIATTSCALPWLATNPNLMVNLLCSPGASPGAM